MIDRPGIEWRRTLPPDHEAVVRQYEQYSPGMTSQRRTQFRKIVNNAPIVDGPVYRGQSPGGPSSGYRSTIEKGMEPGTIVSFPKYVSTSTHPEVAAGYGSRVFEIHGHEARGIGNDLHEAIMPPGKYRIHSAQWNEETPAQANIDESTRYKSPRLHIVLYPVEEKESSFTAQGGVNEGPDRDVVSPYGVRVERFPTGNNRYRLFGTTEHSQPRAYRLDYQMTPEGRIKYEDLDAARARAQRVKSTDPDDWFMGHQTLHDYALEFHPGAEIHGPQHEPHVGPARIQSRFYHGTTVPGVTHVLPANEHGGHVTFPSDTDKNYAYATTNPDDAWDYADKAWNSTDSGRPRVYEVKPIGGMRHVEEDPRARSDGSPRFNNANDYRSRKGWQVVRELPMPEHRGDPEEWDR